MLALGKLGPEFVKVMELNQVPNRGKGSMDDSRFGNGG